jgi:hypothetical protein
VSADEIYGQDKRLRVWLDAHQLPYVLATRCIDTISTRDLRQRQVRALVAAVPDRKWERRSAGVGAHDPRINDWGLVELAASPTAGWGRWLPARRAIPTLTDDGASVSEGTLASWYDQAAAGAGPVLRGDRRRPGRRPGAGGG